MDFEFLLSSESGPQLRRQKGVVLSQTKILPPSNSPFLCGSFKTVAFVFLGPAENLQKSKDHFDVMTFFVCIGFRRSAPAWLNFVAPPAKKFAPLGHGSNCSTALNLLLVQSHQPEIIIVKSFLFYEVTASVPQLKRCFKGGGGGGGQNFFLGGRPKLLGWLI